MPLSKEQILLAAGEYDKYKYVWENCETYADKHHDVDLWGRRKDGFDLSPDSSIIVLGCGDGSLVRQLDGEGFNVSGLDIFNHPLWSRPMNGNDERYGERRMFFDRPLWGDLPHPNVHDKWDLGICADVMEHIPGDLLPIVLGNIKESCSRVLFQIADMESKFSGFDLHPTRMSSLRWLDFIGGLMGGTTSLVDDCGAPRYRFVIEWSEM